MDFKSFLSALAADWVSLMSGIASVIILIFGTVRKWDKVPRSAFWTAAALCFFFASVRVWTTEHKRADDLQQTVNQQKYPHLEGEITTVASMEWFKQTMVIVSVKLDNRGGTPSGADHWKISIQLDDSRILQGDSPQRPGQDIKAPVPGTQAFVLFPSNNFLPMVTMQAVCAGCSSGGWFWAIFPTIKDQKELYDRKGVVIVEFSDIVSRQTHTMKAAMGEIGIHGISGIGYGSKY